MATKWDSLTPRELEVTKLMSAGETAEYISTLLGISTETVKRHTSNIFNKIGCSNRTELAVWFATDEKSRGNTEQITETPEKVLAPEFTERFWKPGESGNPSGRPKKKPITEMYERILNDPENIKAIEAATVQALRKGNMAMVLQLREMADRTEGKVTQPIDANVTMNLAEAIAAGRQRAAKRASK